MSTMPMYGQFLGSTMSSKEGRKKLSQVGKSGRQKMYMEYMANLGNGSSSPTPKPNAGRLASQTSGRTTSSYQTRGA